MKVKYFLIMALLALPLNLWSQAPDKAEDEWIRHMGVLLPKGSKQTDLNRFQSSKSYRDTKIEFYYRFLNSSTMKLKGEEILLPHVQMIHYQNTDLNAEFLGINIYLNMQSGVTEIFFVTNENKMNKSNEAS